MTDFSVLRRALPELNLTGVQVYQSLCQNGKQPHSLLLETADHISEQHGKSVVYPSMCLRITATKTSEQLVFDFSAITVNGEHFLSHLCHIMPTMHPRDNKSASYHIPLHYDVTESEQQRLMHHEALTPLRRLLNGFVAEQYEDLTAFQLVGAFGFEMVECFEYFSEFKQAINSDVVVLYVPEIIITVARSGGVYLQALVFSGEKSVLVKNDMSRSVDRYARILHDTVQQLAPAKMLPQELDRKLLKNAVQVSISDAEFIEQVKRAKDYLLAGDAFQLVLSRRFYCDCPESFAAYQHLRISNPSPYLFYFNMGDTVLLGASPESAVKVEQAHRRVSLLPIAGTRARARFSDGTIDHDLDARFEAELKLDDKEVAEHMMLVDLARNDVARISVAGTRRVSSLLRIERYARVMHLVSEVEGELKAEFDALHALAAMMPMGTLSGAPKIRAIDIIRSIEQHPRGFYGGAVGYLNAAGDMDTAIVIRSAVIKKGVATVQAGAGVVLASDPQSEADETARKAEAVLRAIVGSQLRAGCAA